MIEYSIASWTAIFKERTHNIMFNHKAAGAFVDVVSELR